MLNETISHPNNSIIRQKSHDLIFFIALRELKSLKAENMQVDTMTSEWHRSRPTQHYNSPWVVSESNVLSAKEIAFATKENTDMYSI